MPSLAVPEMSAGNVGAAGCGLPWPFVVAGRRRVPGAVPEVDCPVVPFREDLNVVITRPWEFGVAVVGPGDDPILEHETPITLHTPNINRAKTETPGVVLALNLVALLLQPHGAHRVRLTLDDVQIACRWLGLRWGLSFGTLHLSVGPGAWACAQVQDGACSSQRRARSDGYSRRQCWGCCVAARRPDPRRLVVFLAKTYTRIVNPSLAELDPQLPPDSARRTRVVTPKPPTGAS